jgi:thioredoxin reductase (NADPH)
MESVKDLTIIGGGPTGLFASFYAGLRGVSTRIIDSLPELGGQLTALYPEKYIFDVGGLPQVLAKDLAASLMEQGLQFHPDVVLDEEIVSVLREGDRYCLEGRRGTYLTRTLVICGGRGAFEPRRLKVPGYEELLGRGVHYSVQNPDQLTGKRVLIVGGGDSAVDWALLLESRAETLTLIHRRSGFRAHEKSLEALLSAHASKKIEIRTFYEVRGIVGRDRGESVTIFDNRTGEEEVLEVDAVLALLGFKPDPGPVKTWGLHLEDNRIVVTHLMETNLPGVYAAGDMVRYDGKLDLIATGFSEAAIAVNNAVHYLNPEARVDPGHSTHHRLFRDKVASE